MSDLTVAKTIAEQMGGTRRLIAFLGAQNFVGGDDFLMFRFKKMGVSEANKCKITLDADDTYTMELFNIGNAPMYNYTTVYKGEGLYADMLVDIFESETHLYLHF